MTSTAPKVQLSDDEWRKKLNPQEFDVLRRAGTERPFVGEYTDTKTEGVYNCRACGAELFRSTEKFESHCGWPSFFDPANSDAVILRPDHSLGATRVEVLCANCHSHLGHVFEGEGYPTPTDQRYCINSISLRLVRRFLTASVADADPGLLDDPVWHALTGPHRRFAVALRDAPAAMAWTWCPSPLCMTSTIRRPGWNWPNSAARRTGCPRGSPGGRRTGGVGGDHRLPVAQMVAPARGLATAVPAEPLVTLGNQDADEMVTLAELTRPGPFARRPSNWAAIWECGARAGSSRWPGVACTCPAGSRSARSAPTRITAVRVYRGC